MDRAVWKKWLDWIEIDLNVLITSSLVECLDVLHFFSMLFIVWVVTTTVLQPAWGIGKNHACSSFDLCFPKSLSFLLAHPHHPLSFVPFFLCFPLFSWRCGLVVRTSVCSWRTFPDMCLIYGWRVTTSWVRHPLWVNQPDQLSLLPSVERGMSSISVS